MIRNKLTKTISNQKVYANLMLTSATFLIALEQSGCKVRVVTLNAPAWGFASTRTKQPTLMKFPLLSFDPVRKVAAPETVHGVGSQPGQRPNLSPFITIETILSIYSSSISGAF
mmetsp:Transcript_7750/g.8873  ORF Transcript_7750/g.8873 Transcript_7750/m.8873 type:complete len:114 (+) Transcript_7750:199-540(+)